GTNAGTFTLQTQGAAALSGTFTVTNMQANPSGGGGQTNMTNVVVNPPPTNNPTTGGTGIVGKTLQLSYQGGGGEKFVFTSATAASYENGADTATYTYDQTTGALHMVRASAGQMYDLIIAPGSNTGTTTVRYQEVGGNVSNDSASYTLQ